MPGRKRRKPRLPDGEIAGRVRGGYCYFAFECLAVLVVCSEIRKRPGHFVSGYFPGGRLAFFVDTFILKTQGASLALL